MPRALAVLLDCASKEPWAPAVRKGDEQRFDPVRWTGFVLINAVELGVTQANMTIRAEMPPKALGLPGEAAGLRTRSRGASA